MTAYYNRSDALNVALAGPRSYDGELRDFPFVHDRGRKQIGAPEVEAACSALWRVWGLSLGLVVLGYILVVSVKVFWSLGELGAVAPLAACLVPLLAASATAVFLQLRLSGMLRRRSITEHL